jgi:hypothetical protein
MGIARKLTLLFQALILLSLESPILYRLFHALRFGLRGQYTSETSELSLELTPFHINQMSEWQAKIAVEQLGGLATWYTNVRLSTTSCVKLSQIALNFVYHQQIPTVSGHQSGSRFFVRTTNLMSTALEIVGELTSRSVSPTSLVRPR